MGGIINIIIGVIFVVGGLSGNMVMRGTQSGAALSLIGGGLIAFGIYRLVFPKDD